jgi:hypothetical protein
MNKLFLIPCLMFACPTFAKTLAHTWLLRAGHLDYYVSFPLKSVHGHSGNVKGKGQCDNSECQFLVAAPVRSFDTGDGNRDSRMLDVTKAAAFPLVSANVKFPAMKVEDVKAAQVELSFAGESRKFENVPLSAKVEGKVTRVTGKLAVMLSDFKIERPSLLGVAIDDAVPIEFDLEWVEE